MRLQFALWIVGPYRSILSGGGPRLCASTVPFQNCGGRGFANGKDGEEDKYRPLKVLAPEGQRKGCRTRQRKQGSATVAAKLVISQTEVGGGGSSGERLSCRKAIPFPEEEGLFQPSDGCTDRPGVTETMRKKFPCWHINTETRQRHLPFSVGQ